MTTLELVQDLSLVNGVPVVLSTVIAERFDKQHKHVLEAIRKLINDLPEDFRLPNFRQTVVTRPNPSGGAPIESPAYNLTRDAFSLLVMGFTGSEAIRWKLNFIAAFNGLERLALEAKQREHDTKIRLEGRKEGIRALLTLTPAQSSIAHQAMRYWSMGLTTMEIGKLLDVSADQIRRTLKKLGTQF